MKTRLTFLMLLFLIVSFGFGLARQPQHNSNSCGFAVQGEPAQPTVKGPDDASFRWCTSSNSPDSPN